MQRALACPPPGPPTTWSGGLSGRRTPSGRRATTRSTPQPTAQPCQPSLRLPAAQTGRTAEHSAQCTPARAQHTQTPARFQHAHAHSTRAPHASAAPHTKHTCPQQQQQACHNPHLTHARARTLPTPAHALGVAERNQRTPELTPQGIERSPSRHLQASSWLPPGIKLAPCRHQDAPSRHLADSPQA